MQALGCRPVASVDHFVPEALGTAELVEELNLGENSGRAIKVRECESCREFYIGKAL